MNVVQVNANTSVPMMALIWLEGGIRRWMQTSKNLQEILYINFDSNHTLAFRSALPFQQTRQLKIPFL